MFEQENYTKFSWVSRKASNEGRSAKAMFSQLEKDFENFISKATKEKKSAHTLAVKVVS